MENNAKKVKQKLDKELGRTEKDLLLDLIGEIRLLKKDLPQLDKLQQELEAGNEISVKHFKRLIEVARKLKVKLPDKFKVEVINQQEYPEKIKISNLDEIVIPKRVSIKEAGWLVKLLVKLTDEVQDLIKRTFNVSLDNHTLPPDRALLVRLVTRGGRYYTARSGSSPTVSGGSAPDHSTSDKQDEVIALLDSFGVDGATGILGAIEFEHYEIHEGNHYFICGVTTLGSGANIDFAIVTPDTPTWAHMSFEIEGQGETSVTVYEGSDFDADGGAVTAYNNDRNSGNTSVLTVTTDPTVNSVGTQIYKQQKGAKKVAGFVKRSREIILKQNTKYIFRMTNETTNNNVVSYCGEWYEHQNLN